MRLINENKLKIIGTIVKKSIAISMAFILLFTSFIPTFQAPLSPKKAQANGNLCTATPGAPAHGNYLSSARIGGVALDQAATFLANMDDITGAYYDENLDRIVFIGKTNTSLPEFDKDDLAVTIRSVIFNRTIPSVSLESIPNDNQNMAVIFSGRLEDTNFGKLLIDADYKLKQYIHGYDTSNNVVQSSVSSYKSVLQRYIQLGPGTTPNSTRWWIVPDLVSLKKDDSSNSFVFDEVKMKVLTEPLNPNNVANWNQAAQDFATDQTLNYDSYAQETPEYFKVKHLAQIVGVIKWLSDNGIATDFNWARDYEPKYVQTPRTLPRLSTPFLNGGNGHTYNMSGGVEYTTANSYLTDNGVSSDLKDASEAIDVPKEDIHWTFTENGQNYEAVAVTADAFRSLGSYNTSVTDLSFPTAGDLSLAFHRTYSSYSGGQYGVGRGWSIFPATLYDNNPTASPFVCNSVNYPRSLAFVSRDGGFESFTINDCNTGYVADDPSYHSKIVRDSSGGFSVFLKDQTEYFFSPGPNFKLVLVFDKNANSIAYNYTSGKLASISDNKNHSITVNYNGQNYISSIVDWSNKTVSYTYDTQGNLLTVTDPRGYVTTYTYDTNNKLTAIQDRENNTVVTNSYTPEAKIATQSASSITNTYTYDEDNRSVTKTDNLGRVEETTYDTKARILTQTDPLENTIAYTYGTELSPLTITDKNDKTTTNTYDSNGNLATVTDPNNKTVTYEYNNENRLTKITDERYPSDKITENTYASNGNLLEVDESGQITTYTYDQYGEILTMIDPEERTTTWTRDTFGNPLTRKDEYNNSTAYEYNTIAQLTKITDPENRETTYTYDNNGNKLTETNAVGVTTYEYNKENNVKKIIAPNNPVTQFTYNTLQNLASVIDPLSNTTTYTRDGYQNMTEKQDALNRTTEYMYDEMNRRTEMTTPLGKVTHWEYDPNGNITSRLDANEEETIYEYDDLNRLEKITYPNASTIEYAYDDRGNVLTTEDSTGTTTYEYDSFDRLTEITDSNNNIITYEYDEANNLKEITYPGNKTVTYTYDEANRLVTVTDWNNNDTTYTYYKNNLVKSRALPNDIVTNYTYDNANKLSILEHTKNAAVLAKYTYERNNAGYVTKVTKEPLDYSEPESELGEVNIATEGTGYRWSQNTSDISNSNKVAAAGINDEDTQTDVELNGGADDNENAWEAAGVTWDSNQDSITKIEYTNGSWSQDNNGGFTANFKLQFTTDGTTWTDSGWTSNPAYNHDSSSVAGATYTFTGNTSGIKGARVVGQVRTSGADAWHAHAAELKVLKEPSTEINIASDGTGYRWSQNTSATDNGNKVAVAGINDRNMTTDVELNGGPDDNENAWESAGVTWVTAQDTITKIEFKNGSWSQDNNGGFTANFKLQFTTDGTTWADSGWSSNPGYDYDSSNVDGKTYTFTGLTSGIKGARVVGQVHTPNDDAWHAHAAELKVYKETSNILNIAPGGIGYRWSQNASDSADTNKVAEIGMNDNNLTTDIDLNNGADDNEDAWEGAGVTWSTTKDNITSVEYINGTWTQDNNGGFAANFKLQFTTDGTTWTDSGWSSTPAYDHNSNAASGKKYTFSGSNTSAKGARVVGQVRIPNTDPWHAMAREVRVITTTPVTNPSNFALTGTGYRWHGNTSATADSNKVAATEINDGNKTNEVSLTTSGADDIENAWEAAGVTWAQTQNGVTTIKYKNGSWTGSNNGAFTANVKLQFTTDGTTWTDSGWTIVPAYDYDSSAASNKTYIFTGTAVNIKGARVTGQVHTPDDDAWYANVSEIEASSTPIIFEGSAIFTYDLLDRVLTASHSNNALEYTYNSVGNRLTSKKNGTQTSYTYNNDNQLTQKGSTAFTYDDNGNQIERGNIDLTYDFDNKLKLFSNPNGADKEYIYDGNGNRVEEKTNGNTNKEYVNDVSGKLARVLVAKNISTNTDAYYIYANGMISQGGPDEQYREYFLEDGLGNITLVTNASGATIAEYDYDAYGNQISGDSIADFSYKGEQLDETTGLYFMRARYYDPSTGSFISKDPVEGEIMNPQSHNGYSFVHGNPVNYSDPSGESLETGWDIANIAYDVCTGDWGALAFDTAAAIIPGLPAGLTKLEKAASAAKATDNQINQFEKQLIENGQSSLEKSRRSIQQRLDEHEAKLKEYKEQGGYTSSVEREIQNFKNELDAIDKVLKK